MGDLNQLTFVTNQSKSLEGPYLEIGSKDYGNTQDLRSLFDSKGKYVGIDQADGLGVDCVVDMTHDFEEIDAILCGDRFETVFCLSVLEHCDQPFLMASNITRLLKNGGKLVVSVPFAWHFHGYPSDYWRFTHEGIKKLFPDLEFDTANGVCATSRENDFRALDEDIGTIPISCGTYRRKGQFLRAISAGFVKHLAKGGLFRWLAGYPYVMAPSNIFMVGTLKSAQEAKVA